MIISSSALPAYSLLHPMLAMAYTPLIFDKRLEALHQPINSDARCLLNLLSAFFQHIH